MKQRIMSRIRSGLLRILYLYIRENTKKPATILPMTRSIFTIVIINHLIFYGLALMNGVIFLLKNIPYLYFSLHLRELL